jgi:predicted dehydrogenase
MAYPIQFPVCASGVVWRAAHGNEWRKNEQDDGSLPAGVPHRGDLGVIGVGIVGSNYGRTVLVPAFRTDPRCKVVALAGSEAARAAELARAANVPRGVGDWRALVDDPAVAAVAIAVPPDLQPAIAQRALDRGKPVFAEKPLAADLAGAQAMLDAARKSAQPTAIDFNFPELPAWRRAKDMLDAVGRLRHVVVTWNVENQATRLRLESWKTRGDGGGGLLGNFVCHSLYYLEWFCGPIVGLSARIFPLPDGKAESSIALALAFASGAGGSLQMSCASFLGSGHRLEFYGDAGSLLLDNPTADYFRGFTLRHARRAGGAPQQRTDSAMQSIAVEDIGADPSVDTRVVPVARLVRRFIDACERGGNPSPGFAEGYRVQVLIDAARRSHASGRWVDLAPPAGRTVS